MVNFTSLPPEEIERRRRLSIIALTDRKNDGWDRTYQKIADSFYWKNGPCCGGCDHWSSHGGMIGECYAAPPVSGHQVNKSLGLESSSYIPAPGQPFTRIGHKCGGFRDDFDWSTLEAEYLKEIGYKPKMTKEDGGK